MNKRFYYLIRALLPDNDLAALNRCEVMSESCYFFVKKELTLVPFSYRVLIYFIIQLFFIYGFICSGFMSFKRLSKAKQERLIIRWEKLWQPGYTLFRLLRSLIYLRYFDKVK